MGYRDVRITINGAEAFVRSPYEAKDIIRDMPYRKWNPGTKVWVIPREDVNLLHGKLEAAGFTVTLIDDTHTPPPNAGTGDLGDKATIVDLQAKIRRLEAENLKLKAQKRVDDFDRRYGFGGVGSPFGRRGGGGSWADDMFEAMTPEQAKAAYKKLSTVLHPDLGGDAEMMKLINVAYGRVSK